ncbi:SRPBCC domain-containing protein [Candidatus Daviesbacteria bacterium]|nr:SRPBCC domain-containing protein [Candidatus Daviesbacteria bacterium]
MVNENGLVIERVFNAPVEKVWAAWTEPELIKKWWGPEGFSAPSIKVDLQVGGRYIFAMQGPKGSQWDQVMYSGGVYREIVPNKKIVATDYFCDEYGNKMKPENYGQDPNSPSEMEVVITFEDMGMGKSKLTITYPKPETEEQFQAMLKSGMKEGWNSSLNKLAESLKQ